MRFQFRPITEEHARAIARWTYPEPYSTYNGDPTSIQYLVDPANRFHSATDEAGELVGFFTFGADAQVPGELSPDELADTTILDVGLGLRPDLTGRGLGLAFVTAGLEFASAAFSPRQFRLAVLSWNQRAVRVYEKAGFHRVRSFISHTFLGHREFVVMLSERHEPAPTNGRSS